MRQAARVYFETQVTTTSQGQILIMLYDGAIKFLNQAKERMAAKDYAGKGKLISSAIDVINELSSSLKAEDGGNLAENLNQLYFYCNKQLFMANSRMDPAIIDEVIKILSGIRSAYAQIIDSPEAVAAMAKAKPAPAKAPRAPMGIQITPSSGPVPVAKAHNAYATQKNVVNGPARPVETPDAETAHPVPDPVQAAAVAAELEKAVPVNEVLPAAEAVPENTPEPAVMPAPMPDLDTAAPPTALSQSKRLAASNLYRKFSS